MIFIQNNNDKNRFLIAFQDILKLNAFYNCNSDNRTVTTQPPTEPSTTPVTKSTTPKPIKTTKKPKKTTKKPKKTTKKPKTTEGTTTDAFYPVTPVGPFDTISTDGPFGPVTPEGPFDIFDPNDPNVLNKNTLHVEKVKIDFK